MTDAVDPVVLGDQRPARHPPVDLPTAEPGVEELLPCDQSFAPIGQPCDRCVDLTSYIDVKSKQRQSSPPPISPAKPGRPSGRGGGAASARSRQLPLYDVPDQLHD